MTDKSQEPVLDEGGPSWNRLRQWVTNVITLERKIADLERRNKELTAQVEKMQDQLTRQAGQMDLRVGFIESALDNRVATRAEEAAFRALGRLDALVALRNPDRR